MLISSTGTLVRTPVDEISVLGRNTQGVRLIRLADGERLVGIERIESLETADGAVSGVDVGGGETPEGDVSGGGIAGGDEPGPESSGPPDSTS